MKSRSFAQLFGVLVLAWVALNLPLLLGLRVLPGDAMAEFYPMVYFNVHSIRTGLAPWWNPLIFGGYPQIADPQAMLFSPLLMAWMLLRTDPGTTWFVWAALLHVLMGGGAFLALMRRFGSTDFGATLGAIVFMAGGVAASRIQYVPIVLAYSFLPVTLLALRWFFDRPAVWRGGIAGLAAGAILVEPVQLTYLIGLMLVPYTAWVVVARWPSWTPQLRYRVIGGAILGGGITIAMALPQLLLSYAFVAVSNRPQLPLETATSMSVDWRTFLTLFDPNALQSLRGKYTGAVDPIETFLYIGALPSLLFCIGLRKAWAVPVQRRHLLFFGVTSIAAIVYMVGGHTPIYGWLYHALPGIKQFRRPSDSAYLLNVALAAAVAFGASHVDLADRRRMTWLLAATTCWLLLASLAMRGTGEGWQAASIVAPIAAAAALWHARRSTNTRHVAIALLAVVVVDYRCFNLNGEFNQRGDAGKKFRENAAVTFLATRLRDIPPGELPPRIEATDLGAGWKNLVVLRDLPATHGYGPLRWVIFDRLYGAYSDGDGPRPTTVYNPDPSSAMNRMLGVAYVALPAGTSTLSWQHPPALPAARVYADDKTEIIRTTSTPGVVAPTEAIVLPLGSLPSPAAFASADFAHTVFLTPRDQADADLARKDAATCTGQLTIGASQATNVRTDIKTSGVASGWLVMSGQDFPGWVTRIDGQEVPHHRANGLVRAVCIPAGEHTVTFTYQPWRMVSDVLSRPAAWR
jgi:hypothetical protein